MEIPGIPLLLTCILTINGELFDASSLETGVDTHTHTDSPKRQPILRSHIILLESSNYQLGLVAKQNSCSTDDGCFISGVSQPCDGARAMPLLPAPGGSESIKS